MSTPSLPVPIHAAPTVAPKAVVAAPKPAVAAPRPPVAIAPKPIIAAAAPKPVIVAPKPVLAAASKPVAAVEPAKGKGKYTLQLSAFPTREEADAFAKRFDGTFVIATDLPGKGTGYRVRCGNFGSYQEATSAKTAFEKQNKVIALVSAR
jgi:septal ring-binding cell division protein DamX